MRALVCSKIGSPVAHNVRFVTDWPEPGEPGPGQARIKNLASAFNQMDLWVGRGVPGLDLSYPRISGCDGCGVVEAVGAGVDRAWVGRRVIVNAAAAVPERIIPDDPTGATLAPNYVLLGEHTNGMHAEHFHAPAANLADVGDADPRASAAFGLCALTAWSGLVSKAGLTPGQWVLITGIGGGVATAGLSIARHHGCRVIVTSRHAWKLERARALGAEHAVLDAGQDWSKEVRAATGKRGVDVALDSSGKATHLNCVKSLARGGAYVSPGCTSGPDAITDLARLFWNQLRFLGTTMGTMDEFKQVVALFRRGSLSPAIDATFKAERGAEAYARLEAGEQFGKLVLDWT